MKSQDIGLLLKLICMQKREADAWASSLNQQYSVRALAAETGISKSQVSLALQRCYAVGLAKKDRSSAVPRVNTRGLLEFISYGLCYVFPAKAGVVTRGIATAFAAPVLEGELFGAGEFVPVWSDAAGTTMGQAIEPLFKSVGFAIKNDDNYYALLALVDAVRIGRSRERGLAIKILKQSFELNK